jgi:hypothetical protein
MEKISKIRWEFVSQVKHDLVLDYGSGNGAFGLWRPNHSIVDSYDIGTIGSAKYPQTGIRHEHYDLICFWDVLEHVDWVREPDQNILKWINNSDALAATIPIIPEDRYPEGSDISGWKHYKPGEHLTYKDTEWWIGFIQGLGFTLLSHDMPECPPRIDIHSFLFVRP